MLMPSRSRASVFRIFDAAVNRAAEGLRVAESIARMHLNDRSLAGLCKQLRHDLVEALGRAMPARQIVARDSQNDVGRNLETEQEYQRGYVDSSATTADGGPLLDAAPTDSGSGLVSIVRANLQRAQQSMRTIEELAKLEDLPFADEGSLARQVEQFRFRAYTIEKSLVTLLLADASLSAPSVYVLVDGVDWRSATDPESDRLAEETWRETQLAQFVAAMVAAGVDVIQLRDPALSDRQIVAAGRAMMQLVAGSKTRVIINDRADLAVAAGVHGVHVGQDELPVAEVRRIAGPELLVGVSTHSVDQARQAVVDGADYIGVGPIFPSRTKSFRSHLGPEGLVAIARDVGLPMFAIGGIDEQNVGRIAAAGCSRVAVSGLYRDLIGRPADELRQLTRRLKHALASAEGKQQLRTDGQSDQPVDSQRNDK